MSVTIRTLLDIAAWKVKLPLGHAAVKTGRHVEPPTEAFVSIFDSTEQFPAKRVVR